MSARAVRLLAVLLPAVLLAGCAARGGRLDPRGPTFGPLEFRPPEVRQTHLSGGAQVFLLPDRDVPLVRLYLAFRGGAVYDPPEKAGLAQVASLAWRTGGTRGRSPEAYDEALESRAIEVSLGLGRDKGFASLSVLTKDLEEGLGLLAELVLEPAFRQERIAWAVGQVLEGIRREQDSPDSLAFRELRRHLYRGHPRGVVATEGSAARVNRDDVAALQRRLVTQGTWVLGAVGDFDPDDFLGRLEAHFGRLPGGGTAFPPLPAPAAPDPRLVLVPKPLPQSTIVWARLGPERTSPDFYALELADHALGAGGFQSRLVREIRSNRGLAYSVGSFYDAYPEFGVLGATAATKNDSASEVLSLLRALVERAGAEGFDEGEIGLAREAVENRYVFRFDDPANLVREQMGLALDGLPAALPARYLGEISSVTPERVGSAAAKAYGGSGGITVIVGGIDPEDPVWKGGVPVEVVRLP